MDRYDIRLSALDRAHSIIGCSGPSELMLTKILRLAAIIEAGLQDGWAVAAARREGFDPQPQDAA